MEEDIEKALNNLWNSLDDEFFNLTYSQEQMQEDIRLILNRYNYLDSKCENLINKYKELEKERDSIYADYQDLGKDKLKLEEKCEEQEKMIELMAEYIKETDFITESYCYRREDCENVGGNRKCKECILDYFRKKAKGE